ncbi:tyrosine-protein phosphatase [Cardinium endosymbiont of Culicoides punctatus]|uniref:tyrosine-protein phosphatase n=1 Tax=Cardinium endosymbiont of Culicoides punctatus TaxID=2304601 RepID=UPI001058AD3A|nr:tyrosine-protein phosphatase [Cardinium endosymbiont of Culicoides punctatus]TDG95686.1 hypothetical protein CCPUN_01490 [Cardinium endosymbiont of Culicoides punctatus]
MVYLRKHIALLSITSFLLQAWSCSKNDYAPFQETKKRALDEWSTDEPKYKKRKLQDDSNDSGYDSGYDVDDELNERTASHTNFNFKDEIEKLRKATDIQRGIKWILQGDTLVRDATNANGKVYAAEDYAIQVLNILRAAKKICELYGKDGKKMDITANRFMDNFRHIYVQENEIFCINKLQQINTKTVSYLKKNVFTELTENEINEKLRLAENYVGLDDIHYNITTKFKIEDKEFALEDKKWLKLTQEQQSSYKNRKEADWYKRLDSFEQKLIDTYFDKFLDGNHYIPTQIRNIPGCKNAYRKRLIMRKNGQEIVLARYYHSGAFASFVPNPSISNNINVSNDIATNNWQQILEHSRKKTVEVMSLNNKVIIERLGYNEKHIVEQMEQIVGKDFMYLPINGLGIGTIPIYKDHVNNLVQEANNYKEKYPNLLNKTYFEKLDILKQFSEKSDKKHVSRQSINVSGNHYADIAADYIACKTILEERKSESKASVLFSCKSGKDRTGFISYLADGSIIHTSYPELPINTIHITLANTSHYQLLAGLNGGMPGRFGMKPVKKDQTTRDARTANILFPQTAKWTNIPLLDNNSQDSNSRKRRHR